MVKSSRHPQLCPHFPPPEDTVDRAVMPEERGGANSDAGKNKVRQPEVGSSKRVGDHPRAFCACAKVFKISHRCAADRSKRK